MHSQQCVKCCFVLRRCQVCLRQRASALTTCAASVSFRWVSWKDGVRITRDRRSRTRHAGLRYSFTGHCSYWMRCFRLCLWSSQRFPCPPDHPPMHTTLTPATTFSIDFNLRLSATHRRHLMLHFATREGRMWKKVLVNTETSFCHQHNLTVIKLFVSVLVMQQKHRKLPGVCVWLYFQVYLSRTVWK